MPTLDILLNDALPTALFSYPFQAGWLDATGVTLAHDISAEALAGRNAVALLDAVQARALLGSHVIVRDAAVAARRASFVIFATHTRPDEVGNVSVSLTSVPAAGVALAQVIIPSFYGVPVAAWTRAEQLISDAAAQVHDGARALLPLDDEEAYQEDLGRAWYLETDTPFVSHVCVAPRAALAADPAAVSAAVGRLLDARATGKSRARELRRDLSRLHDVDREVLTETLADQALELGQDELKGLTLLWNRAGLAASDKDVRGALVTVRQMRG